MNNELIQKIMKDTMDVQNQRIIIKDGEIARLMQQVEDLKKGEEILTMDRDEARRSATGWQVAAEAYKDEIKRWQNT